MTVGMFLSKETRVLGAELQYNFVDAGGYLSFVHPSDEAISNFSGDFFYNTGTNTIDGGQVQFTAYGQTITDLFSSYHSTYNFITYVDQTGFVNTTLPSIDEILSGQSYGSSGEAVGAVNGLSQQAYDTNFNYTVEGPRYTIITPPPVSPPTTVPEPGTITGSFAAFAMGVALRRKYSRKAARVEAKVATV